jgi:CxxC-x17-CxxC domain-containing protein
MQSRQNREMFDAVCARCGQACQVPFRPSNIRPVYCKDCYQLKAREY